jgi:hypothetical protein
MVTAKVDQPLKAMLDGRSALMPVSARTRYVTSSGWSTRRCLGHVPTPRHHERSELNIVPMTGGIRSAQITGHDQYFVHNAEITVTHSLDFHS